MEFDWNKTIMIWYSSAAGYGFGAFLEKRVDKWGDYRSFGHKDEQTEEKEEEHDWREPPFFSFIEKTEEVSDNTQFSHTLFLLYQYL